MATGKVVQVIGPVVDVEFPPSELPDILSAVAIDRQAGSTSGGGLAGGGADANGAAANGGSKSVSMAITGDLIAEVAQHLGDNVVRCIAMESTDGLVRGMSARDTGAPI